MSGKFIVIEGLEGAGKSTAMGVIEELLTEQNSLEVVTCREPGGTPMGEEIRHLVKHFKSEEKVDSRTELLLMYASRIQLIENIIKPALKAGKWVLCDRFFYSTYAYQGGGRGIDLSVIDSIHQAALGSFAPDLVVYMDIDPKTGLQRAAGRGELDRFEKEAISFFEKTGAMYKKMLGERDEMTSVDASLTQQEVAEQVKAVLIASGIL